MALPAPNWLTLRVEMSGQHTAHDSSPPEGTARAVCQLLSSVPLEQVFLLGPFWASALQQNFNSVLV